MKAQEISDVHFEDYGVLYELSGAPGGTGAVNTGSGDGWQDANTAMPVIDTPGSLGYTSGTGAPFAAREMERHQHTQEALFCAQEPIVFLVAPESDLPAPKAEHAVAVILRPGQVAVLRRGVWHSSAHGLCGPACYYYLALCCDGEPTEWKEITGGPVAVEI